MISELGGIRREYHYFKDNLEESDDWNPVMLIVDIRHPEYGGYAVRQDCIWMYDDPKHNKNPRLLARDLEDFNALPERLAKKEERAKLVIKFGFLPDEIEGACKAMIFVQRGRSAIAAADYAFRRSGFLRMTAWNLIMALTMLEKNINGKAISQMLNFIQDGLQQLKDMPPLEPEKELTCGEVEVWEGGTKIASKDLGVKESDLIIEGGEA